MIKEQFWVAIWNVVKKVKKHKGFQIISQEHPITWLQIIIINYWTLYAHISIITISFKWYCVIDVKVWPWARKFSILLYWLIFVIRALRVEYCIDKQSERDSWYKGLPALHLSLLFFFSSYVHPNCVRNHTVLHTLWAQETKSDNQDTCRLSSEQREELKLKD